MNDVALAALNRHDQPEPFLMETIREHRVERLPGRSAEYAVAMVLLLAFSGLFFGFSVATFAGVLSGTG
ncbi:hypothetical protein [Phenylobacterium sp.]|uniref:hypothetical protein n=1 Tax=Phenylobacterium sp. TaxID=1871053 RepID=UPI0035B4729D